MLILGPIGFAAPLVLLGFLALPLLWMLLRTLPPPARQQWFPPVALLFGLKDDESETRTIPLWLRILRMLAIAGVIIGFSDPVYLEEGHIRQDSGRPALLLVDGSWAGAAGWQEKQDAIEEILEQFRSSRSPVALLVATDLPREFSGFREAGEWIEQLAGISPNPWLADGRQVRDWIESRIEGQFDTWWISDGIGFPGQDELIDLVNERGGTTVIAPADPVIALGRPDIEAAAVRVPLRVAGLGETRTVTVQAVGRDPAGNRGTLQAAEVRLEPGGKDAVAEFRLPMQLRNRIESFESGSMRSAGSVVLVADSLLQRRVGLVTGRGPGEGGTLLSSFHYLRRAVSPFAELIEDGLEEILQRNPDVILLADASPLPITAIDELGEWVGNGGLLVRFAGPRLAAGSSPPRGIEDLFPVRLRLGSRVLGGAMSWDTEKTLKEFDSRSPFHGLEVGDGIAVRRQVLAQPGPELFDRTLAELEDGTPLVTGASMGSGQIVLFHIPANAEWSNLPLSGLFLRMLERLALSAGGLSSVEARIDGTGQPWVPESLIDAFGVLRPAEGEAGVREDLILGGRASSELPPGLYRSGGRLAAINAVDDLASIADPAWPANVQVRFGTESGAFAFKGEILALAVILFLIEAWATFRIGGRLATRPAAVALAAGLLAFPGQGEAQLSDRQAISAVRDTVLAYVVTGDSSLDRVSRAGLLGLSRILENRTTVELAEPVGVDPGDDIIAMFPLVYWPVTPAGPELSENARRNLQNYLKTGGMILFDTRDALVGGSSAVSSNSERLFEIADPLGIPALGNPGPDHTLTRSFYLINQFPGRYEGDIWVEHAYTARGDPGQFGATSVDGVTPVVIGGNDWASAWAVNDNGTAMFAVGAGETGNWQRELAYRFGVNLVMHALTGNYKLDQLHVDALVSMQDN